jgi:hypothetical protein
MCLLAVLALLPSPGAAEVSYEYSLTDDSGDVVDMTTMDTVSLPAIDILSVSTRLDGEMVNITMNLETNYTEEGEYLVTLLVDEAIESTFGWDRRQGFYWFDSRYQAMTVNGAFSEGGESLHWEAPIEKLNATSEVWITHGDAKLLVDNYARWQDSVWEVIIPVGGRTRTDIVISVVEDFDLVKVVTIWLDEFDSDDLRAVIDGNGDLTVTQDEVDDYQQTYGSTDPEWKTWWATQNDIVVSSTSRSLELVNATGPVYSSDPITKVLTRVMDFPHKMKDETTLRYDWAEEFIAEGGVVPWDVSDTSSFTFQVPENDHLMEYEHLISSSDMTYGMYRYLSSDASVYMMAGSEMRAFWNETVGQTSGFTVTLTRNFPEEVPPDDDADDTMCGTSWIAFAVLPVVLIVSRRGGPGPSRSRNW